MVDLFALLGVPRDASDLEIKEAYRRLAKQYHPDSAEQGGGNTAMMVRLNHAKTILFDPIRREEHRVYLSIEAQMSRERMERFRQMAEENRPSNGGGSASSVPPRRSSYRPPEPTLNRRQKLSSVFVGIAALLILVGGSYFSGLLQHPQARPLLSILERHPISPAEAALDTMTVPNDSLAVLKRKANVLMTLGEYRSASHFLQRCLDLAPGDPEIIQLLSLAYFKRGQYAQSLDILSKQIHGDSNLVVAYYNIGELFLREQQPLDALNAFQESLSAAQAMEENGRPISKYRAMAEAQIQRLR